MKSLSDKDLGARFRHVPTGTMVVLVAIPKRCDVKKSPEGIFANHANDLATNVIRASNVEPWTPADSVTLFGAKPAHTMTVREVLAAYAMQGFLSGSTSGVPAKVAKAAVEYADALINSLSSPS